MQSKTSFFNRTLFRKNMTRFWPLWATPSFVGALFPLAVLTEMLRHPTSYESTSALELTGAYYEIVTYALPIISLCYAILVAIAVWSYLFNSRSVGMMHTLPIRREGLFLTGFLSGMAMLLIPYVVTGALAVIIFACFGLFNPAGILITVLCVIGESLFYFGSATLVAFITGNLFAMPVLYFILHFLAVLMDLLVNLFASGFLFGVDGDYSGVVEFLSPTVYLLNQVRCDRTYEKVLVPNVTGHNEYFEHELVAVRLDGGWIIAVYALVGVALLALAYALYRKRRSESAGDVVSVGWMKPVFRYGVSICGSMAGGLVLYAVFWGQFQSGDYYDIIPLTIFMVIAGVIFYYAASMLLAKSLRVFRGSWKGLGVTALCAAAICCVLHFDLFGVETRVPSADQIDLVSLYVASNNYSFYPYEDAELLEEVRAVHLAIAKDAEYITDMDETWSYETAADGEPLDVSWSNTFRIQYYLKNGTRIVRRYYVPMTRVRTQEAGTYDQMLDSLVNSDAMKAKRFHLDEKYAPTGGYIYADASENGGISFGNREAEVVMAGLKRDIAAGACGDYDWFENYRGGDYAMDLSLEFQAENHRQNGESYYSYDSINIRVTPAMTNTVGALLQLNLVAREDLKTRAQLWPEEYSEYGEKYGALTSFPTYSSSAASFAVIGGSDGPTEVTVAAVNMDPNSSSVYVS